MWMGYVWHLEYIFQPNKNDLENLNPTVTETKNVVSNTLLCDRKQRNDEKLCGTFFHRQNCVELPGC